MASEDNVAYRMDPAEMLWPSAVRVDRAGADVIVVEIVSGVADRPAPPSPDSPRAAA